MTNITVIEQNGQRVLTTNQLAEVFGTEAKIINRNFQRNVARYIQGKHVIILSGEALREFKGSRQFDDNLKFASILYLWTEKGAWLHAKSINTDKAWDAYEKLVDDYYRVKDSQIDISQLSPELQMFKATFDAVAKVQLEAAETQRRLETVQSQVNTITETFAKRDEDWRKSINSMLNAAARSTGGQYRDYRTSSYRTLEERARCNLNIRLTNLKERLSESGATKTKINQTTKMDVIESDTRLKEIYTTIVKELSIGALRA